jgi:hypothetical protein
MAADGQWERALLSQLTTRNVLQDRFFREVLSVHGQTASDERQFRSRVPSEVHHAVLLENADLQRRVQEAEQRANALSAENESLKAKVLVRARLRGPPWGSTDHECVRVSAPLDRNRNNAMRRPSTS